MVGRRTVAVACVLVLIGCAIWWAQDEQQLEQGDDWGRRQYPAEIDQVATLKGSAKPRTRSDAALPTESETLPVAPADGRPAVQGVVVDETGKPVEGVGVQLQQGMEIGGWLRGQLLWGNVARLTTPEDGSFRLPAARDDYQRRVWAEPSNKWSGSTVVVIEDIDAPCTLTVQRAPNLAGVLLDAKGHRLRHGTVQVSYKGIPKLENATADGEGRFEARVPPGARHIKLQLGKTEQQKREKDEPFGTVLYDVPIGSMDLELRLQDAVFIRGVVEGVDGGSPISGSIWARRVGEGPASGAVQVFSGIGQMGNAAFMIGPVRPGKWKLVAQPSDARYAMSDWTHVEAPTEDAVITCQVTEGIHGQVEGENVEGFRVVWRDENTPLGPRASALTVKADGSFHIPHGRNAPHSIYVSKRGDERMAILRGVRPGPAPLVIRLRAGLVLEGSFKSGAKHMGRRVIAAQGGFEVDALADESGHFRILGLGEGDWQLDAVTKSWNTERKSGPGIMVPAGSRGIVIEE